MPRYVAFLRGVNVAGHNTVGMAELREIFEKAGLRKVATHKASGNVLFDSVGSNAETVRRKIESMLQSSMGGPVQVFVRTFQEVRRMVQLNPFSGGVPPGATPYVTLLPRTSKRPASLSVGLASPGVEILLVGATEIYSLGRSVGGRPGFPNGFLEKALGVPATTRNWSTILGVSE